MVLPINSLANMEYMLYGGTLGANANCPSIVNGYRAGNSFLNCGFNPYLYNNSVFNMPQGYNPSFDGYYGTPSTNTTTPTSQGGLVSQQDVKNMVDYYVQSPSESLAGSAVGGAAFSLINNTRLIAHPINSVKTLGEVEKLFKDVKVEGSGLNRLWSNPDTHKIITDAYHKAHKLEMAAQTRVPLFKRRIDSATYNTLKSELETALTRGDKQAIAVATEKIKKVCGAKTGWIPQAWNKMFGGVKTVSERLADTSAINAAATKNVTEAGSKSLAKSITHGFKSQGLLGGGFFAACEFLMDFLSGDIQAAFRKDSSTGMKQLGQTSVKAAGSIIGWTVGEAAGAWAGAKLGAMAGTAICPGVGTAIGAIAGLVGGSIGCALMGKLTHKLIGDNVGAVAQAEEKARTPQGMAELLQVTAKKAQEDKNIDPKVLQSLNNIATVYTA